jgi:hypothetical protein
MATLAQLKTRLEAGLEAIEDALASDMANAASGVEEQAFETIVREIRDILANQGDKTVLRSALASLAPFAILTSAARTADATSADFTNTVGKGLLLLLDITAGTGTIDNIKLYGKNADASAYLVATLTPDAAIGGAAEKFAFVVVPNPVDFTTELKFTAGAQGALPSTYYVVVDHTDATSVTYTLDGFILV